MSTDLNGKILAALRARYPAGDGQYVNATEVGEALAGSRRRADFLAMSCWASRGLNLFGFEIKTYRGDWLREIKNPAKGEQGCYHYCDYWYIVAPAGLVKKDELPPTWGLMEYDAAKDRLDIAVKAPEKEARALTREFTASFMRAQGKPGEAEITARVNREVNARMRETEERCKREVENARAANERLEAQVGLFERTSSRYLRGMGESELRALGAYVRAGDVLGLTGRTTILENALDSIGRINNALVEAQTWAKTAAADLPQAPLHEFEVTYLPTGETKAVQSTLSEDGLFFALAGLRFTAAEDDIKLPVMSHDTRRSFARVLSSSGREAAGNIRWKVRRLPSSVPVPESEPEAVACD